MGGWTRLDQITGQSRPAQHPFGETGAPIKGRWLYQGKAHIWGQKSYKIIKHDQRMAKMNPNDQKLFRMTIFFGDELGMDIQNYQLFWCEHLGTKGQECEGEDRILSWF